MRTPNKPPKKANEKGDYPSLYLYVKENSIAGLSRGWYSYDFSQFSFQLVSVNDSFEPFPAPMDTYSIFQEALCALFFTIPKNVDLPKRDSFLLQAGRLAQRLMEQGVKTRIGICPIGQLDSRSQESLVHVMPQEEVIHALFAGGISLEQIEAQESSKIREGVFEAVLKEYLKTDCPAT